MLHFLVVVQIKKSNLDALQIEVYLVAWGFLGDYSKETLEILDFVFNCFLPLESAVMILGLFSNSKLTLTKTLMHNEKN